MQVSSVSTNTYINISEIAAKSTAKRVHTSTMQRCIIWCPFKISDPQTEDKYRYLDAWVE
jgi:hypothetical protein